MHVHGRPAAHRPGARRPGPPRRSRARRSQYHLGDHLGSSNVVVDGAGALVNREEYTPYGETSFGSFARKRYRFTGKERDEESGLAYHGARYYAPWLGRWASCDPAAPGTGTHAYAYLAGNPVRATDSSGLGPDDDPTGAPQLSGGIGVTITPGGVKFGALGAPSSGPCDELAKKCVQIKIGTEDEKESVRLPDWMKTFVPPPNKDVIWRKSADANPMENGMAPTDPDAGLSLTDHVFNEQASRQGRTQFLSATELEGGPPSFEGNPWAIDVEKTRQSGSQVHGPDVILDDMARQARTDPRVTPERIRSWHQNQVDPSRPKYEGGETLIEGPVPASAIESPLLRTLRGGSQVLVGVAIGMTVANLVQAAIDSVRQGDIRPLARQVVREASTWGMGMAMAAEGAAFGAEVGLLLGGPVGMAVGTVVFGILGGLAGAIIGSGIGDFFSSLF